MMRLLFLLAVLSVHATTDVLAMTGARAGSGLTGGSSAGSKDSFKTDLFTGASTHSVPLVVPPGTNGFEPSLVLQYNSHTGTTWLGRGWDLSIPFIQRSTRSGIPSFDDNQDVFVLGADRLVKDKDGIYRTAQEDFNRLEYTGAHWVMHRRDGVTHYFGETPETRMVNPDEGNATFRWLLTRSEDPHGNFIRYEYTDQGSFGGAMYPLRIEYGFSGEASPTRVIEFTLASRSDITVSYEGGVRIKMAHRLSRVTMKVGGTIVTYYNLIVHSPSVHRNWGTLIKRIVRVGAGGSGSLPYDEFFYSGQLAQTFADDNTEEIVWRGLSFEGLLGVDLRKEPSGTWGHSELADVNGDGAPDLIVTAPDGTECIPLGSPQTGAPPPPSLEPHIHGTVYLNRKPGTNGQAMIPPTGTDVEGLFYQPPVPLYPWNHYCTENSPGHTERGQLVDYNGDGLLDVFMRVDVGFASQSYVYKNTGQGWAPDTSGYASPPFHSASPGLTFVDVNADGLPDALVGWAPQGVCPYNVFQNPPPKTYLNTGDGWQSDTGWTNELQGLISVNGTPFCNGDELDRMSFFDVNGDGLVDVGLDTDGDGAIEDVRIHNGRGWIQDSDFVFPANFVPADLDGDGLVDDANGPNLNRGVTFIGAGFTLPAEFQDLSSSGKRVVDLDGDGIADFVRAYPNASGNRKVEIYRSGIVGAATKQPPSGLLIHIDLATGGDVDLQYEGSGEGSCYDATAGGCHVEFVKKAINEASCTYPLIWTVIAVGDDPACYYPKGVLPFAVTSVRSITTDDGNGNVATSSFRYDGGRFDPTEQEYRGFRVVEERPQPYSFENLPAGQGPFDVALLRRHTFYQLTPLRGLLAATAVWRSTDDVFNPLVDELLAKEFKRYAVTRAGLSTTLIVQPDEATLVCDPQVAQITNPGSAPNCPFETLAPGSQYLDAFDELPVGLAAPLPYDDFRGDFVGAADAPHAYLALEIGSVAAERSGSSIVIKQSWQWHEEHGNVQLVRDLGDAADPADDRMSFSKFAGPLQTSGVRSNFHSLPERTIQFQVVPNGGGHTITEETNTVFFYDTVGQGLVDRGALTLEVAVLRNPLDQSVSTVATTREYFPTGLLQTQHDPATPGEPDRSTSFTYDVSNTFVKTETRAGLTTTYEYDPTGAPVGMGLLKSIEDPNGAKILAGADKFGRPTTRQGPTKQTPGSIGVTVSHTYNDVAGLNLTTWREKITETSGPGISRTTSIFIDGLGRTIRTETSSLGVADAAATIATETRYNVLGQAEAVSRPAFGGATHFTRTITDELNRPRLILQPNGGIAEYLYEGLVTTRIDAAGRQRDELQNGQDELVRVTEYQGPPNGNVDTAYEYDSLGRIARICAIASSCAGSPITTTFLYDSLGRRVQVDDPDRGVWQYAYDGAGRLETQTDARGDTIVIDYDLSGRPALEDWGGGPAPEVVYFYGSEPSLNNQGRLTSIFGPWGATSLQYDDAGRVSRTDTQLGGANSYAKDVSYDWADRIATITYPDDEVITWNYDKAGVETVVSSVHGTLVANVEHNADGNPTKIQLANGIVRELGYDPATGALNSLCDALGSTCPGGTTTYRHTYGYDLTLKVTGATNLLDVNESLSSIQYDGVGRLTQVTRGASENLAYTYDAIGNLTSKEGQPLPYDDPSRPHALWDVGDPQRYQYDPNGNQTVSGSRVATYDSRSLLTKVSIPDELDVGFVYNASRERVRKVRGAAIHEYFGSDLEILQQGARYIKTVRAEGLIVARISTVPSGGGATAHPAWYGQRWIAGLAGTGVAFSSVLLLACMFGRTSSPRWRRAVAVSASMAILLSPVTSLVAWAAKGDLTGDDDIDSADLLWMMQAVTGNRQLSPAEEVDADIAPFADGEVVGDQQVDSADLAVLTAVFSASDFDADGVPNDLERLLGFSILSRDTDQDGLIDGVEDSDEDGLTDLEELALGTDRFNPDHDGDGYVDGIDPDPLNAAGSELHWVHTSRLLSTAILSDAAGVTVRSTTYGIWGEIRADQPSAAPRPTERFTGERFDQETGLTQLGSRYLDSTPGRFSQPDEVTPPPANPQNLNPYAYALNDPLNRIDPSGNTPIYVTGLSGSQLGGGVGLGGSSILFAGGGFDGGYGYDFDKQWRQFQKQQKSYSSAALSNNFGYSNSLNRDFERWQREQRKWEREYARQSRMWEKAYAGAGNSNCFGSCYFGGLPFESGASPPRGGAPSAAFIAGVATNAAGFAVGGGEYSNVWGGQWRASRSLKDGTRPFYDRRFPGNQYTGSRNAVLRRAAGFKFVGRLFFGLGTVLSIGDAALGNTSRGQAAQDITFGAIGTFAGPLGWLASGSYFGSQAAVAFFGLDPATLQGIAPEPPPY